MFYTSGRASLETSYLYQLLARMYGTNNLPDSSNMCHESTSVALPKTIGVGVGTVTLDDFDTTDCIFFFGQNVGSNSPRMLHQLQDARKRDVPIVTFNPIRETGLVSFANPQSPAQMLTGSKTQISTQYHQVRIGGDVAALMGVCKLLLERDDEAQRSGGAESARHAVHPRAHPWLRGVRGASAGVLVAGDRALLGTAPCRPGSRRRYLHASQRGDRGLRNGTHAASQWRRDGPDADQPAASARQHRQARSRNLPRARTLQRPGPTDGGDYRETGAGPARQVERAVRFRATRGRKDSPRWARAKVCCPGPSGRL